MCDCYCVEHDATEKEKFIPPISFVFKRELGREIEIEKLKC